MSNQLNETLGIKCDNPNCGCHVQSFMWISHILRCIYFETPKACSTSIRRSLGIRFNEGIRYSHGAYKFTNYNGKLDGFPHYFKFGFVRNPYDRFVSIRSMKDYFNPSYSFDHCLEVIQNTSNHYWIPYDCFLPKHVQFIGRFENFETDWKYVCRVLQIPNTIGMCNKTDHADYREYYISNKQ